MKRIIIDAVAINLKRLGFYGETGNWLEMPATIKNMQSFLNPRRRCLLAFFFFGDRGFIRGLSWSYKSC